MKRPISVKEAAKLLDVTEVSILKAIRTGRILAEPLSDKGWLVCHESVLGLPHSPSEFKRLCRGYVSVPEACEIVRVVDSMVCRMLADGRLNGFRLNSKAWAVDRKSAEQNLKDYIANPPTHGRPRRLIGPIAPKQRPLGRSRDGRKKTG